jgi:hypothetical protein
MTARRTISRRFTVSAITPSICSGWRGSDEFCNFYPFHTYQFDLFQFAIQQLSKHGVFTGKYLSVGERSMLAVFQEVAKAVRNEDVGISPRSTSCMTASPPPSGATCRPPSRWPSGSWVKVPDPDSQGAVPAQVGARVQGHAAQCRHPADQPARH